MQKNILNHLIIILTGVISAQMLATLHVYLSDKTLFHTISEISNAGYLAVPNALIMPSLTRFFPAFCGGLFFTLTIGITLSLTAFAGAWIWDRITGRNKRFLFLICICWIWCIGLMNINGFALMPTAYFLIIPLPVFWLYSHAERVDEPLDQKVISPLQKKNIIIPLIFFIILIIAGATQMKPAFFSKFRDNLMLSNYPGIKINKFYYDYTLYAAQVFKSLEQKTLKTCILSFPDDPSLSQHTERILLKYDYLVLPNENISPDMTVAKKDADILFKNRNQIVLQTASDEFFSNPKKILEEFSHKTDRHIFFRQFTFFSILFSSAVGFYLIPFLFFRAMFGFLFKPKLRSAEKIASSGSVRIDKSEPLPDLSIRQEQRWQLELFKLSGSQKNLVLHPSFTAGILSLAIGIVLIFYLSSVDKTFSGSDELSEALASDSCSKRVDALKFIFQRNMEIAQYPSYKKISESHCISDRYRLAKALGISRSPETYPVLLNLLDDANFNVAYNAFFSLGIRGEKNAVGEILKRIKLSDNWYVQWYAYRALKKLGWTQTR